MAPPRRAALLAALAALAACACVARAQLLPPPDVAQDVALQDVALRDVVWLGTHNSMAIASQLGCGGLAKNFASQAAPVAAQLAAGVRVLNLDVAPRGGRPAFVHGHCANARVSPAALLAELAEWLAARPGESLVLHFDDSGAAGDEGAEAALRAAVEAAVDASPLAPLLYRGPLDGGTRLSALRGRAALVFDAPQWAGGGAASSAGRWLKAWGEASSGRSYVADPAAAAATRDAVAAQLLDAFGGARFGPGRCGGAAFRSFSLGSGDWACAARARRPRLHLHPRPACTAALHAAPARACTATPRATRRANPPPGAQVRRRPRQLPARAPRGRHQHVRPPGAPAARGRRALRRRRRRRQPPGRERALSGLLPAERRRCGRGGRGGRAAAARGAGGRPECGGRARL